VINHIMAGTKFGVAYADNEETLRKFVITLAQRRHCAMNMKQTLRILQMLSAGVLLATTTSFAAPGQEPSQANLLLRLMRVDDYFEASTRGLLDNLCSSPVAEGRRAQCARETKQLLQMAAARRQLATLMTPYIEAHFTADEIAELVNFYGSAVGNEFADFTVWLSWARLAMPKDDLRSLQPAVLERVQEFFTSAAGKKFFDQFPQYKTELDRQSTFYLCDVLNQKAMCAALQGVGLLRK
jgi:hypothetical protein